MADIIGKDGSFRVGATIVGALDSWTINRTASMAEVTSFGDTFEEYTPTIKSWTASISGTLNSTDAQQLAIRDQLEDGTFAAVAVNFYLAGTTAPVYKGSAFIESDSIGSTLKDRVTWSANIRGNGALEWDPS